MAGMWAHWFVIGTMGSLVGPLAHRCEIAGSLPATLHAARTDRNCGLSKP